MRRLEGLEFLFLTHATALKRKEKAGGGGGEREDDYYSFHGAASIDNAPLSQTPNLCYQLNKNNYFVEKK